MTLKCGAGNGWGGGRLPLGVAAGTGRCGSEPCTTAPRQGGDEGGAKHDKLPLGQGGEEGVPEQLPAGRPVRRWKQRSVRWRPQLAKLAQLPEEQVSVHVRVHVILLPSTLIPQTLDPKL